MLRHDLLISLHFKLCAHSPVGPHDAHDIGAGLFAQTEMKQRTGDRLLLHQQTGTDLHFTAHAERVDALVADCLDGARSHHLPVIVLRAVIDCLDGFTVRRKTHKIESAVAVQIGSVKDQRRADGVVELFEIVLLISQPNERASDVARRGCGA